jgi:A/G-specific adenine glycosylase
MDALTAALLDWYDAHRRALPWRDEVTPYRTWISEVMLQQTRVQTVLPYFARFMARFPTVEDLAAAPADEVMSLWSGLGYYSRARNMHRAAKMLAEQGSFPTTLEGIRALPGVGEYMAGAIGSIALGLDAAAVDGNLHRVLSRLHASSGSRKEMWAFAEEHLPSGRAGDYNQALMDIGSQICTPRRADCPACPMSSHCAAHAAGEELLYPAKVKKKKVPRREAVCGVLRREGLLLLARRPAEGLYGGLFELPGDMLAEGERPEVGMVRAAQERLGLSVEVGPSLGSVQHTLTHMKLTLHVLPLTILPEATLASGVYYTDYRWLSESGLVSEEIGISTLGQKALALAASPAGQVSLF